MKQQRVVVMSALALIALLALVACAPAPAPAPTAAPPTAAPVQPTAVPPTAAPAQPTAVPPTAAAAPTTAPAQAKPMRIFWSNQQVGHPFWNVVKQGFEDAAKHYGFQLDSAGPTKMDDAAQISMIEAAFASGQYDGFAIPGIVPDIYQPEIDKIVAKGIPVVVFCCDVPKSKRAAFVGTSPFGAGQKAGQALAKATGGNAVVNIITGKPDEADLVQRIAGFQDALKAYPNMKIDSTDTGAAGLTENVSKLSARLISSPNVNGFFGAMAEGGAAVLTLYPTNQARLKGTHTVTMDDLPQTLDGIRAGTIDAAIVQAQYNWGYGAIYELHRILQKKLAPTADSTDTGTVIVTKDNVENYAKETMDPKQWLDYEAKEPK